jgi:hypothetical protein
MKTVFLTVTVTVFAFALAAAAVTAFSTCLIESIQGGNEQTIE